MPLVEWLDNYQKRHLPEAMYQFDSNMYFWYAMSTSEYRTLNRADGYVETECPNCDHQGATYQHFFKNESLGVGCKQCELPLARIFLDETRLYTTSILHPYHKGHHKRALIYLGCVDFFNKTGHTLRTSRRG